MQPHLDALNALQNVPWTINRSILAVVKACHDSGVDVKGLPEREDVPMPPKPRAWDSMTDDEKKVWRREASEIEKHNRSLVGSRVQFIQDMRTAEAMAEQPQFYTPMNSDWRGRVYAVCHFNFQRDDRVRALFQFANGAPIGEEGLYWLKVHVANCGDFDKISKKPFPERITWVQQNLVRLRSVAQAPLRDLWWTKADKPFLFLAACMELRDALAAGPQFVTRLPVSFDGSCSGLQHLCAMTRAPEGALVNLTPGEYPQDVYQTVALVAEKKIRLDAEAGDELAKLCLAYGVTRSVVKRNVMTYSYSSKTFGMAKQQDEDLIEPLSFDVLAKKLPEHPFGSYADKAGPTTLAAKYLAETIYNSIKSVIDLPQQAMVFLQKCARAMAHEGKPLTWTTPTGLPWANRYHVPKVKRIELWLHDTRVQLSVADGVEKEIDKERAANGVAPNFVHALDAAHLALTVRAAASEGIDAATVHDSFGCLAPHATRFNQIIREQFVGMYEKHDVLGEVLAQAKSVLTLHNQQRLPKELEYGSLDLRGVLRAQYAFA
jgi:DNA-directed RNA polymerase